MRPWGALVVLLVLVPLGSGGTVPLPLHAPQAATATPTALVGSRLGSRLAQVDPATLAVVRRSAQVGYWDGWVASPDRRLLAVGVHRDGSMAYVSTLDFANASTLRWARDGVRLHGVFRAALWLTMDRLLAVTGDCCGPAVQLEKVDTVHKRVLEQTSIPGPIGSIVRAGSTLVMLGETENAVAAARLVVVGSDGGVRSVRLDRIEAGWHYDQATQDPIGTVREPGLAVDPDGGVAYVVDASGLVAAVQLADLSVSYHTVAPASFFTRLSAWLTPAAAAKGANGPTRNARWLGDGLVAVTGDDESVVRERDGSTSFTTTPVGLTIIDTRDWSVRTIDTTSDDVLVAEGLLLASGTTWHSDSSGSTFAGEGIAAYRPDETLAWRFRGGEAFYLVAATGSRAVIGESGADTDEVLNLADGTVVRRVAALSAPWLLLGAGSGS